MIGSLVDGKYRIVRELGKGGMGAVYEAVHDGTGRRVALKVIIDRDRELANDSDTVVRFQREARAAGAIDTEHIVQIFDTGTDPATKHPFMVMEYLSGQDVSQLVRKVGPLPPDLALRVVSQAASGLKNAHDAGVIHRDIKPANLYLAKRDAGAIIVKVLDFGIAKVTTDRVSSVENAHLTRTGSMLGSPLYMSPEQAKGSRTIDPRTDIWSLGVVLYEALCGRTPNAQAESLGELIIAICGERARPIQDLAPWVSPDVARIVHRMLEIHPANRFQSMSEVVEAIWAIAPVASIHEQMLMGLTPQERAYVATRLEALPTTQLASPHHVPPAPISQPGMVAAPTGATPLAAPGARGVTTGPQPLAQSGGVITGPHAVARSGHTVSHGGVSATLPVTTQAGSAAPGGVLAGAVLGVALLGGAGWAVWHFAIQPRTAHGTTAPAPVTTESSPPPVPVPAVTTVTRKLTIEPPTASVEVDGKPVAVESGVVSLEGAPGDTRQVRVTAGEATKDETVVITKDGLSVDKVVVPPPKSAGAPKPAPAAPPAKPVPAPAPAKPAPAPARSGGGISRQTDEFGK